MAKKIPFISRTASNEARSSARRGLSGLLFLALLGYGGGDALKPTLLCRRGSPAWCAPPQNGLIVKTDSYDLTLYGQCSIGTGESG